jgi:YesN/AraC family two-component response regulator
MLVDIGMPGIDGMRIARDVARCDGPRPTLVAVSGFSDRAHRRAAVEAGFDHYLVKPIEPRALEQFLRVICASRRPALPAPALTA